ncbi:FAD binding domain-containing protein [Aspergillus floccosus]
MHIPPHGIDTDTTVIIVGAGSTGLALAHGLKKAGIPFIIIEKHDSVEAQPRDWNMGLHWGAGPLESLIPKDRWAPEHDFMNFLNGETGEQMGAIPANKFYRLRRRKLRGLLAPGLDVHYGQRLHDIKYLDDGERVTAILTDGKRITARLIVGADGSRSDTRNILLSPDAAAVRQLPYCATFIQARFSTEHAVFLRSFHPLFLAAPHPAGYMAFFGMHDAEDSLRPETWMFFFYISWHSTHEEQARTAEWTNAQRLQQAKGFAKLFVDPWKSAYEWLPDDHQVWYMNLTDFDPREPQHRWDSRGGRVTLAGDAAHAMTYQRGQGLNHSFTDAMKLTEAIEAFASQLSAIAEYEDEMISRSGAEVALSTLNTGMVHDWEKVLKSPVMTSGMKRTQGD